MTETWSARILLGDCLEVMGALDPESIDAVVTDPPYGIRFMGQAWDGADIDAQAESIRRHQRERIERGTAARNDQFAGAPSAAGSYDLSLRGNRGFQVWTCEWAEAAFRVLKPGGHLLSFSAPRTYHRMTVGIEEAGFEIRDSLHWIFGSGFPKSLDVSKAIDRRLGAEREPDVTDGREQYPGGNPTYGKGLGVGIVRRGDAGTPEAAEWDGWGTALKPAHEPVVLARKPLGGTVAENVLEFGVGGINVAGCRVGDAGGTRSDGPPNLKNKVYGQGMGGAPAIAGRWPANVLLSHLPACEGVGASHTDVLCAPGCPVAELNEVSGNAGGGFGTENRAESGGRYGDFSGASKGKVVGFGDSGGAARFFYVSKPRTRERVGGTLRNLHPTVKPIELMRYLVRLITPPGGVVLDPFVGSGTTGCAAMVEGFRFVGIEREAASHETALARVSDYAFAHGRPRPVSA